MLSNIPFLLSPAVTALLSFCILFLSWRLWTFTIRPYLWPSEPRYMPYWLPFIGHLPAFMGDCHRLLDDCVHKFGKTGEPFALTAFGMTCYCLSEMGDVAGVLDGAQWTHGLVYAPFIQETMKNFGVSHAIAEGAYASPRPDDPTFAENNKINPGNLSLFRFLEGLFKQQMLITEKLDVVSKIFSDRLQHTLRGSNFTFCARDYNGRLYGAGHFDMSHKVALYSLVSGTMVDALVQSLFGPCLQQLEPDIVDLMTRYNTHAWIMFYGLPDFFGMAPICEPRDRIKVAFRRFINRPEEQRHGQCFAIEQLLRYMSAMNMDMDSRVGLLTGFFFPSIASEQNACYWLVAQILYDTDLLEAVRQEMEPAWHGSSLDVQYLMSNCPLLDAIFSEILRQRVNTFGWRVVKTETVIRGKTLRAGTPVIIPMRVLHNDASAWGANVDTFDPARFKGKTRHASYRPFGSGPTHCPGRVFAKRGAFAFVAILLHRFHVTLLPAPGAAAGQKPPFPLEETRRPATGVKGPAPGTDVYVKLDERVVEMV